jgi:hypothetical protein
VFVFISTTSRLAAILTAGAALTLFPVAGVMAQTVPPLTR